MIDLKACYENLINENKRLNSTMRRRYFVDYKESSVIDKLTKLNTEYKLIKGDYIFNNDIYAEAICTVVTKNKNNKDTMISVYKKYDEYLANEYGIHVDIEYPPIPVSNTLERLLFIAKYLQDENHKVDDLERLLWHSKRQIENDIRRLRGRTNDSLQVCGRKFLIKDLKRKMGKAEFESTVHPIFLTANLTQVIIMLEGLMEMSNKPECRGYALPMAQVIWEQLSDYAKNRILYVTRELLHQDISWLEELALNSENSFITERECSDYGQNVILDCLKNPEKQTCFIEYGKKGKSELLKCVSLYIRRRVLVSNKSSERAVYVYEYNRDIKKDSLMREPWGCKETDSVWYACYGSNLDENRFRYYIEGGVYPGNGKLYEGCKSDRKLWGASKVRTFKGQMYFGNASPSWGGQGVAFYDSSADGETIMRLYKISRVQLHEIHRQEGNSLSWYDRLECLDVEDDGCPVYTITSKKRKVANQPSNQYLSIIRNALITQCGIPEDQLKVFR